MEVFDVIAVNLTKREVESLIEAASIQMIAALESKRDWEVTYWRELRRKLISTLEGKINGNRK